MASRHTGPLLGGGTAVLSVGGLFMAVEGLEPGKKPPSVWASTWFDLGFLLVLAGLLVVAVGLYLHFRKGSEQAVPSPNQHRSRTWGNVRMSGFAQVDSSADLYADAGAEFTESSVILGRHVPGRPDLIANTLESADGESSAASKEKGQGPG